MNNIPVVGRLKTILTLTKKQELKNKSLLDIGCGGGWLISKLSKSNLKKTTGVDPNQKAIESAKKENKKSIFKVAPAENLPFKDNSFDIITMFDSLEHVPKESEQIALKEVSRVLKKGGSLLLSTPNYHWLVNFLDPVWYFGHRHYRKHQLSKLLKNAGFKITKYEIRGGIWFSIYLLWLYTIKRITRNPFPRNKFLEKKDDQQFKKPNGIHTIFLIANKT